MQKLTFNQIVEKYGECELLQLDLLLKNEEEFLFLSAVLPSTPPRGVLKSPKKTSGLVRGRSR